MYKIIRKLGMITALFAAVMIPIPSYAAAMVGDSHYQTQEYNSVTYYTPTEGSTHKDWVVTMSTVDPGVCLSTLDQYYMDQDGNIFMKSNDFSKLSNLQTATDQWVAVNEEKIVPAGTAASDVPYVVARWEAACLSYDYKALDNKDLARLYQNAYSGLTTGKGICATYALIFNSIVIAAPINPGTGLVDFTCKNPTCLPTRYVNNSHHAWSAVLLNGQWRWFDVCSYDLTEQDRFLNFAPGDNSDTGLYSTYFEFD